MISCNFQLNCLFFAAYRLGEIFYELSRLYHFPANFPHLGYPLIALLVG
jgi:hypothetical protein